MMETVIRGIDDNIIMDQSDNANGEMDLTLKELLADIEDIIKEAE